MSFTPSLKGHHPKSYAMNAYLTKGIRKSNVKIQKRLKQERKRQTWVWKEIVSKNGYLIA
jgi:hypothetical protein